MLSAKRRRAGSPVVALSAFIDAIRDSGYRTPAHALAELVDNSLEAGANSVNITIHDAPQAGGGQIISVTDDGCGMPPATLQMALQFGGSTRFNARTGTGRYGMGLPCSALSQARRVDVYSWQSPSTTWWTYLDARSIADGVLVQIPAPKRAPVPGRRSAHSSSGTVVVLSDCDRIDLRSPSAAASITKNLGRIFRRAIIRGASVVVNGEPVCPVDPLFSDSNHTIAQGTPYGPTLEFPMRASKGATSTVRVHFTELPIRKLHMLSNAEKADAGITKGAGVSIVRAGREIDYGWYFMGAKRKENYDDWWRCEVEFDPILDELFGLTHTKQRVNPTPTLTAVLAPHLEPIARMLNRRVRDAFQQIAALQHDSIATRRAQSRDNQLEPPQAMGRSRNGVASRQEYTGITGLQYRTCRSPLRSGDLFKAELVREVLTMTVNTHHPFYEQLLAPLLQQRVVRPSDAVAPIELLLLAYCRAETTLRRADRLIAQHLREQWAEALNAYVG
jgi:hypothetical protein